MTLSTFKGFTLVELVAVILVLSVIAAFAVPRFVDLSDAARRAAVKELAGDLLIASTSNLYIYSLEKTYSSSVVYSAFPVDECDDAGRLLVTGLPEGYFVEATVSGTSTLSHLESVQCDVVDESNTAIRASFTLHGINPSSS